MYQRNKFSRTYKVKALCSWSSLQLDHLSDILSVNIILSCLNVIVFLAEASFPLNVVLSISHTAFVKGDHTNFEIDPTFGVEASEVYPDVKYTPVDEILNQYVWIFRVPSY